MDDSIDPDEEVDLEAPEPEAVEVGEEIPVFVPVPAPGTVAATPVAEEGAAGEEAGEGEGEGEGEGGEAATTEPVPAETEEEKAAREADNAAKEKEYLEAVAARSALVVTDAENAIVLQKRARKTLRIARQAARDLLAVRTQQANEEVDALAAVQQHVKNVHRQAMEDIRTSHIAPEKTWVLLRGVLRLLNPINVDDAVSSWTNFLHSSPASMLEGMTTWDPVNYEPLGHEAKARARANAAGLNNEEGTTAMVAECPRSTIGVLAVRWCYQARRAGLAVATRARAQASLEQVTAEHAQASVDLAAKEKASEEALLAKEKADQALDLFLNPPPPAEGEGEGEATA